MEKRWKHPLFKPSRKSSRELDMFSSARRTSPKYYSQVELTTNIRIPAKNVRSFGTQDRLRLSDTVRRYRFPLSISFVFLACIASLFIFLVQTKLAKTPSIYASNLFDLEYLNANPVDKASFLRQLSADHRQVVNGQIHFVSELIKDHRISREEARRLAHLIVTESLQAGYDPFFVTAVIKSESTFRKHAVSPVGALGLMQIMPDTGKFMSKVQKVEWTGASKLRDPRYNIRMGIGYLKYLDEMFKGDKEKMLVAYNWGPGNVLKAMKGMSRYPSSCVRYARSILNNHGRWNSDYMQRMAQYKYLQTEMLS